MRTIDADAMKAEVKSLDAESNNRIYQCAMEDMLEFFIELIDKQPTIEPEVRHGRWVVNDRNPDYADCTNCGLSEWLGANGSRDYAETLLSGFKKFCPNCGAKMDGGADNG